MTWPEVMKINSDLTTPLNALMLVNQIDIIGDNYTVSQDTTKRVELMQVDLLYQHKVALAAVYNQLLSSLFVQLTDVGLTLNRGLKLNYPAMESLATWAAVVADATALAYVSNSPKLLAASEVINTTNLTTLKAAIPTLLSKSFVAKFTTMSTAAIDTYIADGTKYPSLFPTNTQFANGAYSWTVPTGVEKIIVVAVGAGANGNTSVSGAGGDYQHIYLAVTAGDIISGSVTMSGTTVLKNGVSVISLGVGTGVLGTPTQSGKLLRVSTRGGGNGGGGGYGGANGGGTGAGTGGGGLVLVAGQGGGSYNNLYNAPAGGGGGGSGYNSVNIGGGGGYGGGGAACSASGRQGNGNSGVVAILY